MKKMTLMQTILSNSDKRHTSKCTQCDNCTFGEYCPHDCQKCLEYIHFPTRAPTGAPDRKYDCMNMADVYTCKYAPRYTSEIIYALRRLIDLKDLKHIKVLSFGCGPCTDLFALDYLKRKDEMHYQSLEYRGIDYSENVWARIHKDIKDVANEEYKIRFFYIDMCDMIRTISQNSWTPNLIVFQYVFSDMHKHTGDAGITEFINTFSQFYNKKALPKTYIILNDINLSKAYGGGREYFDQLYEKLDSSTARRGRFCNDNARYSYHPRGYPYGDDSDGEFLDNRNLFNLTALSSYSPFNTCASAQMLIKKEVQ